MSATACNVCVPDPSSQGETRMVLLGKTGSGKSASGNTILGRDAFVSELSPSSVTSECEKARGSVGARRLVVVDTPGIYDTNHSTEEVLRRLSVCISLSAPGPRVFLIVIKLDRFTECEIQTVELLQDVFGDEAAHYSMVLFTQGDSLGRAPIENFYRQSPQLCKLIQTCSGRYHVFNNKNRSGRAQVSALLGKIDCMVWENGGTFYTNAMYQAAERAIQERMEEIQRRNAVRKQRKEERLRDKFHGQMLQAQRRRLDQEFEREARSEAEKKNRFVGSGLAVVGAEVGVTIGLAAAAMAGPVCLAVAAAVGGIGGALVGLLSPRATKALKNKCSVQ